MKKENRFWNRYAKFYDKTINASINESYEKLYASLIKDTNESDNVLEMATGTGEISIILNDRVQKITAIDFAENMLNIAMQKAKEKSAENINFKLMDCCDLDFENQSFDTIICCNALHLMSSPSDAMREMLRVLKNDGQVIVPTYCHGQSLKSRIISFLMSLSGFKARNKWSVDSFVEFIEINGFEVTNIQVSNDSIPLVYVRAKKFGENN